MGILLALLMLALGCAAAWDRALLRGSGSPRAIEILPSGKALCRLASGDSIPIADPAGGGVARHWVALRLESAGRRSFLLSSGMLPPEEFRRLRLWARWARLPGVAPRQLPA